MGHDLLLVSIICLSILLQCLAAWYAYRMIDVTGKTAAWALIVVACSMMAMRRVFVLWLVVSDPQPGTTELVSESLGLVISVALFFGMKMIAPVFHSLNTAKESVQHSERMLRRHHESLLATIQHMPVLVFACDEQGRIQFWNHECERVTGYLAEEIQGREHVLDLLIPDAEPRTIIANSLRDSSMQYRGLTAEVRCKNGHFCTISWSHNVDLSMMTGWKGWTLGIDISDLQKAQSAAEHANRLKSEFLANMSHEIRTPLNIILGYTDIIQESVRPHITPQEREFFTFINAAARQLMLTIDHIIDVSRFHISDFPLNPQIIPIVVLVRECVQELEVLAQQKQLELRMEADDELLLIEADPYAVTQSFTNIIQNAIKYTHSGHIHITCKREDPFSVAISVKDTGIGISEDYLPHLFDEFSQEHGGYGRPYEGAGLGMALTKKFVESSRGTITVESRRGVGSTFTVTFPLTDSPEALLRRTLPPLSLEPSEGTEVAERSEKHTVLLVEDDAMTREFMVAVFNQHYTMLTAADADSAFSLLRNRPVHAILMDLSIAGSIDGLQLTRLIRLEEQWRTIPIFALTAHAQDRDRERCLEAGCTDYFSKPVNRRLLLQALSSALAHTP